MYMFSIAKVRNGLGVIFETRPKKQQQQRKPKNNNKKHETYFAR